MTIDSWIIIALISAALVAAFRPAPARAAVRPEESQARHDVGHALGFHD